MEWLWEHLWPLKEGLVTLVSLSRLALAMHLARSWHSSLMHSACCLQGSILGATACSPCRPLLPPLGSLHQGTLKWSTWRGIKVPTQLSPIVILGSTFDTLFSTWQPCCGAYIPTGTGSIPVFGWYSSPDALCITHSRTVDSGGSGQLPSLSSWYSRKILLPTLLV